MLSHHLLVLDQFPLFLEEEVHVIVSNISFERIITWVICRCRLQICICLFLRKVLHYCTYFLSIFIPILLHNRFLQNKGELVCLEVFYSLKYQQILSNIFFTYFLLNLPVFVSKYSVHYSSVLKDTLWFELFLRIAQILFPQQQASRVYFIGKHFLYIDLILCYLLYLFIQLRNILVCFNSSHGVTLEEFWFDLLSFKEKFDVFDESVY